MNKWSIYKISYNAKQQQIEISDFCNNLKSNCLIRAFLTSLWFLSYKIQE